MPPSLIVGRIATNGQQLVRRARTGQSVDDEARILLEQLQPDDDEWPDGRRDVAELVASGLRALVAGDIERAAKILHVDESNPPTVPPPGPVHTQLAVAIETLRAGRRPHIDAVRAEIERQVGPLRRLFEAETDDPRIAPALLKPFGASFEALTAYLRACDLIDAGDSEAAADALREGMRAALRRPSA